MQIPTIRTGNRAIWMQIPTIYTGFEAFKSKFQPFECKFQPIKLDSRKHSNANANHLNGIQSVWMPLEPFKQDSDRSNEILTIRMPIWTIQKQIRTIRMGFEPL